MENDKASSCLKPVIMMVVTQILYFVMNILYKLVEVSGMNLIILIAYRLMFSTAILVPLALILERKTRPKLTRVVLFQAFILGLFGETMAQILYIECIALTSPTFLAAIYNLLPGMTFVIALCLSMAKIVSTVMGIGGAMLFTFYRGPLLTLWSTHIDLVKQYQNGSSVPLSPQRSRPVWGFLAGLGSTICFAIWLIVQAKMSQIYPCPYSSTALMCCMGSIQSVVFAIFMERDWNQWKLGWDIRLWTAAYAGIVISGLAFVMMSWCVQKRGPLFVAIFNPLEVLMVAVASSLFLDEKFTLGSVLGGVLIVCGLYIVLWGKSKDELKTAPHASQTSTEIVPSTV